MKRGYKKVVDGPKYFSKIDPDTVYSKCPYFKAMMDDMLLMAKQAGL